MLLEQKLLECFLAGFKVVRKLGVFAFKWDSTTRRFVPTKKSVSELKYYSFYIPVLYATITACQVFLASSTMKTSTKLQCTFILICLFAFLYSQWIMLSKSEELMVLVNRAIQLEENLFNRGLKL